MRAGGGLAQQRLELGEVPGSSPGQALRDGIEIGAAGGQVARECAPGLDDFADDRAWRDIKPFRSRVARFSILHGVHHPDAKIDRQGPWRANWPPVQCQT